MTYHHEGATGSYTLTGRDAELELARTVIREVWKRNWPLVIDYGMATLGSIVVQYFFSTDGPCSASHFPSLWLRSHFLSGCSWRGR
jgi:hypothetical protein